MPSSPMLHASGLNTFANFLSEIPEGSLVDATNVVIDRDGIIEPRRGIKEYANFGTPLDIAKQLLTYRNRLLVHYGSTIAHDNTAGTGVFTDFVASFPEVQAGLRIKGIEANGNFYVTTSQGIKKIAAATTDLSIATISDAGVAKALDLSGVVNYSTEGFLTGFSKVAYRVVWGTRDINDNLILGFPSNQLIITNFNSQSGTVDLTFTVPSDITTTSFFYQVYRTATSVGTFNTLSLIDPGDEMKLVYEAQITNPEILAGQINVNDSVGDTFQAGGTLLYTNEFSGEGINQGNDRPPVSKDIASFKGSLFFANTRTRQQIDLALLGIGGFNFGDIVSISATNPAVITTSSPHLLASGDRVAIVGTGVAAIDTPQFHLVTVTGATTFEIPVLGAASSTGSWYASYLTVTDGSSTNRYFFVGRPEVTPITFDTALATVDGSWFNVWAADDTTAYAVWFDKTGTTAIPTDPGKFFIRVLLAYDFAPTDVAIATDTITIPNHGFLDSDTVTFTSTGTLPAPLVSGTTYFIVGSTTDTFQVAATSGGTAINLTTIGTATHKVYIDGQAVNVSTKVKVAVEEASLDFDIVQTSASVLTFSTANNGPATDATPGTTPPGGTFAIGTIRQGFGEDTTKGYVRISGYDSPGQAVFDTASSLVHVINSNPVEIINGFYVSNSTDAPGLLHFERRDLTNLAFTIQANNATVGALFNLDITTAQSSTDEEAANRLYFSKYQQPEAVPALNYLDIGPKNKSILRIVALRDSLFVLKEDGVYRVTGEVAPNFSVTLFDGSCRLIAPDTCSVIDNQIYSLTNDGVSTITETGIGLVSRPIENNLNKLNSTNFPDFSTASFGVAYRTEHSYYLWTVTQPNDAQATQCFRYHTITRAWTRWNTSHTCVVLNDDQDKLYFGAPDESFVEVERKTLSRKDYADREFTLTIADLPIFPNNTLKLSSVDNLAEGDALVQTQYVTIYFFNSLLKKLDDDPRIGLLPGTFFTDYYATLALVDGGNLTTAMTALVAHLNADPGTSGGYVFSGSTNFATIQTEYNTLIAALNLDPLLKFFNYAPSVGTIEQELTVDTVSRPADTITADHVAPVLVGPITAFKGIRSSIVWAPYTFGDPSLLKHVSESTIMFETGDFRGATVDYNTDLSPNFEGNDFKMDGNGTWGGSFWGENTWDGFGTGAPMRDYIPRQKQRCRYIRSKFTHNDAFYKFAILGISYFFEVSSQRAYRGRRG